MLFIVIFILSVWFIAIYFGYTSGKKNAEALKRKNWDAYEEFLNAEMTMTEHEKEKAKLFYMLFGKTEVTYSGRKFTEIKE